MPDLTIDQLTVALAVVGAVAVVCIFLCLVLLLRLRKLRRQYAVLRGNGQDRDILSALSTSTKWLRGLEQRIEDVGRSVQDQAAVGRFALQKFALVRYDAFEDMGGQLSFSAALLDDNGDGVVITSINGRTETRTYAKPVHSLNSSHNLSEEEQQAIAGAASGMGRGESQPATASRSF